MKIVIECGVASENGLKSAVTCPSDGIDFIFLPGENGKLARMRLIKRVPDPSKFYSEVRRAVPPVKLHIHVKEDIELLTRLQHEFQTLESIMGLQYGVQKVHWENATYRLIPETPEEHDRLTLLGSVNKSTERAYSPAEISPDSLQTLVQYRKRYTPLIPALAFYREGLNEQASKRFINAFVNFYYVIEGLYGRGKTKNYQVAAEFRASSVLIEAARLTVDQMRSEFPEQYAQLLADLKARRRSTSPDDLLQFIVDVRGDLHHFTGTPSKRHGIPFYHANYEGAAFLTHGLAIHGLLQLVVVINQGADERPEQ